MYCIVDPIVVFTAYFLCGCEINNVHKQSSRIYTFIPTNSVVANKLQETYKHKVKELTASIISQATPKKQLDAGM